MGHETETQTLQKQVESYVDNFNKFLAEDKKSEHSRSFGRKGIKSEKYGVSTNSAKALYRALEATRTDKEMLDLDVLLAFMALDFTPGTVRRSRRNEAQKVLRQLFGIDEKSASVAALKETFDSVGQELNNIGFTEFDSVLDKMAQTKIEKAQRKDGMAHPELFAYVAAGVMELSGAYASRYLVAAECVLHLLKDNDAFTDEMKNKFVKNMAAKYKSEASIAIKANEFVERHSEAFIPIFPEDDGIREELSEKESSGEETETASVKSLSKKAESAQSAGDTNSGDELKGDASQSYDTLPAQLTVPRVVKRRQSTSVAVQTVDSGIKKRNNSLAPDQRFNVAFGPKIDSLISSVQELNGTIDSASNLGNVTLSPVKESIQIKAAASSSHEEKQGGIVDSGSPEAKPAPVNAHQSTEQTKPLPSVLHEGSSDKPINDDNNKLSIWWYIAAGLLLVGAALVVVSKALPVLAELTSSILMFGGVGVAALGLLVAISYGASRLMSFCCGKDTQKPEPSASSENGAHGQEVLSADVSSSSDKSQSSSLGEQVLNSSSSSFCTTHSSQSKDAPASKSSEGEHSHESSRSVSTPKALNV